MDNINHIELEKISGTTKFFEMTSQGREALVEVLKKGCLSPERLKLKREATVMFTKNSPTGSFVNGTLGTVIGFGEYNKNPIVRTHDGKTIETEMMDWNIEDNGKILARISQIPLRLAWAITVHKSQGMSLDRAYMDLRDAFVEGQGYVALSRVRTLSGLYLAGYNKQSLKVHPEVLACDENFRNISAQSSKSFSKLSSEKLSKMHSDFIRAVGGTARAEKVPTLHITKKLLEEGKNIKEIAKHRKLTEGTVLSHIEDIMKEFPETVITHLRPPQLHIDLVKKHHKKSDGKLTHIKYAIEMEGYDLSYDAIRIARMFA